MMDQTTKEIIIKDQENFLTKYQYPFLMKKQRE